MAPGTNSLAAILKQTHIEDDNEVLQAAEHALKSSPDDVEAQHVKIVALLKLDRFEDALQTIETGTDQIRQQAQLEYAYALYKAGRPSEAARIAREHSQRGFQHVEAQASYRAGDFARAAELYKSLASDLADDTEADLNVNGGAVDAQLEWIGQGHLARRRKTEREDMDAFETAYNAACACIARGELRQGEVLLKRAKDICGALEDMTDEEKQNELVPITVQQIYVLTRAGKLEEAQALVKTVDAAKVADKSTRYIARVNAFAASSKTENPFLAERLISQDLNTLRPDYPFKFQAAILEENQQAVALQTLKHEGVAASTARALAKGPMPTLDPEINALSVINAAAHAKGQTGKEALKYILPLLEKRPYDVGLVLTIAQIYVLTGNISSATTLLEKFMARLEESTDADKLAVRYAPGLVGALVTLYTGAGRQSDVRAELGKAVAHLRSHSQTRTIGQRHLLSAAGKALLESNDEGDQKLAGEIFKDLYEQDPNDRVAAAGLLAFDPSKATKSGVKLTPIEKLIAKVDVDALENGGIAKADTPTGASVNIRKRPAEDTKPVKAKKPRKSRLPKDYDPNKKPDPERWLPLRDRSTYRPRGKKGKAKQAQFSQGAAPALDSEASRPSTPAAEVLKAKQGGGGASKKKKGKAKW